MNKTISRLNRLYLHLPRLGFKSRNCVQLQTKFYRFKTCSNSENSKHRNYMVCLFDVLMILPDILEKYFSEFSLKKKLLNGSKHCFCTDRFERHEYIIW